MGLLEEIILNTKKKLVFALPFLVTGHFSQAQSPNESDDFFAEESLPIVLSATRLRQSQLESPAAVTIIDREQIKASGARNVVEALRQVPGLALYYSNGSTPEVSIHSLLTEFSRRMQVLVDGQSIFKPGLSRVLWNNLPVNIDEIERIEVIRGPNTSSYGSNAFLGVINIITRHPSDVDSHSVSVLAGNHGIADAYVRVADQGDSLSYRLSAGYQQDDGFTGILNGRKREDANNREYLRADISYNPDISNQWRFTLGHSQSEQEVDLLDEYQIDPVHPLKVEDSSININWEHHFSENFTLNVNAYHTKSSNQETWRTCPPAFFLTQELGDMYDLDPVYAQAFVSALVAGMAPPAPTSAEVALLAQQAFIRAGQLGTSVACGTANQNFDEVKWGFEFVNHYQFSNHFRMVAGLGIRDDKIRGNSLFDGEPSNNTLYFFSNFEWRLNSSWLVNGGLLYEDDDYVDSVTSPRLALNYIASENSAFRLVAAKGVRTPDFYEQLGHRHYQVVNLSPAVNGTDDFATFYLTPQSSGNLFEETIRSYEFGWFYSKDALSLDIKIFHEEIENAIDGLFTLGEFDPRNTLDFDNHGIDLQLEYQLTDKDKLWATFSHLDHDLKAGRSVNHQMVKDTASLMYQRSFNDSQQFSIAYYNQTMGDDDRFERADLRYGIGFNWGNIESEIDFVIQHRFSKDAFFTSKNVVADQTIGFVRARFNF